MTPRELRERAAALNSEIETERERLGAALQSMDYQAALAHQMKIDQLEREALAGAKTRTLTLEGP